MSKTRNLLSRDPPVRHPVEDEAVPFRLQPRSLSRHETLFAHYAHGVLVTMSAPPRNPAASRPGAHADADDDSDLDSELLTDEEALADLGDDEEEEDAVEILGLETCSSIFCKFLISVQLSAEASISKIFGGGFSWQAFAYIATLHMGLSPRTVGFAFMSGLGDALGVFAFSTAWFILRYGTLGTAYKLGWYKGDVNMPWSKHFPVVGWLMLASFLTGSVWQPSVNMLGPHPSAKQYVGTAFICGSVFWLSLILGRLLFSAFSGGKSIVHSPTWATFWSDGILSMVGILGADANFVSTENGARTSFLVEWFFEGSGSIWVDMAKAGASTCLGFFVIRTVVQHPIEMLIRYIALRRRRAAGEIAAQRIMGKPSSAIVFQWGKMDEDDGTIGSSATSATAVPSITDPLSERATSSGNLNGNYGSIP